MEFKDRYKRNLIFTENEQANLKDKCVAILGIGGLGGYVFEELVRIGVGKIIACDFDVFSETNLNRQLLSTEINIGEFKVDEAVKRAALINSEVQIDKWTEKGNIEALKAKLGACDAVVDCLDTAGDRLSLEKICNELDLPLIHGAIDGWFGQVTTILPGDNTLEKIYKDKSEPSQDLGNVAFTAATVASIEVSETIKVLLGKDDLLRNKMLLINLLDNDFSIVSL